MFWMVMFLLFTMQFYNDFSSLGEALKTFTDPADIFNCYARIVVNSPNFKWTVCSTLCSLSSEAFQNPEASDHIKFSDAFDRKKLKARIQEDMVSEIFLIIPLVITSLMTFPFFFSHILWAQIEYCWFTMLMWMSSDFCISCGQCCCKKKPDPKAGPVTQSKFRRILTV